jgi:16S rRNA (adenine1518-N6/adenine1519-N6)-dimethyltransferase
MEEAGFRPSSTRGQNFLIEEPILRKIVEAALPLENRTVLEVGTGLGFLTAHLVAAAPRVVTVEIDDRLHRLAQELSREGNAPAERVVFVRGDALGPGGVLAAEVRTALRDAMAESATEEFVVVSNLPYSVAGPVVAALVTGRPAPERMVLLSQREMAERILGRPGTKEHGPLSALVALGYTGEFVRRVPAEAFRPRPKVASVVLRLSRREGFPRSHPAGELASFSVFLRALFGGRRKALRAALARGVELRRGAAPPGDEALAGISLPPGLSWRSRPEEASAEALLALFRECSAKRLLGPLLGQGPDRDAPLP